MRYQLWLLVMFGLFAVPFTLGSQRLCGQSTSGLLDNATVTQIDLPFANDIVYDPVRDLIYASIGSDPGFPLGNSIMSFDPQSLTMQNSIFIGSEPGQLAISADSSRVYAGIDGAFSIRYWDVGTANIGSLTPLWVGNSPGLAEDISILPGNPDIAFVSVDEVGSSANGTLFGFSESMRLGLQGGEANSLAFSDPNTLITFNSATSGRDLKRYEFDGQNLVLVAEVNTNLGGGENEIESVNGLIVTSNHGDVVDAATFQTLGSFEFPNFGAIEPIALDNTTYQFSRHTLRLYSNETFELLDSIELNDLPFGVDSLIVAGQDRLALLSDDGRLAVISNIPVSVIPEPSSGLLISIAAMCLTLRRSTRETAIASKRDVTECRLEAE